MKTPPAAILPVLDKVKSAYHLWFNYYQVLPKTHRYSLGVKVDRLFIEIIEAVSTAGFLSKEEKLPWVKLAIRKTDALKIMLMIIWETKSLNDQKYIDLSLKIEEFGRDLGGWNGKLSKSLDFVRDKQNSPIKVGEK